MNYRDSFVGHLAQNKRGVLSLEYPIQNNLITNWDAMKAIWHHTFYSELRVDPRDHPLLLTGIPMNNKRIREKATQVGIIK